MEPWRIGIVEPLTLIREALRELLASDKNLEIVGEASDAIGAKKLAAQQSPNVLLLDASLLSAALLLSDIIVESPETSILVLTEGHADTFLVDCLRAGAKGVISKDETTATLIKALNTVATGNLWAPRRILTDIVDDLRALTANHGDRNVGTLAKLTQRERTITALVGQGQMNKQIANALRISEKTVRNHLTAIYRKLRCQNRTQLAAIMNALRPSRD